MKDMRSVLVLIICGFDFKIVMVVSVLVSVVVSRSCDLGLAF